MMTGRKWRACFGVGAFLAALATVGVSAVLAAPTNLEFDPPSYDFGQVPYGSGPSKPHEFTLTNTGETQLVTEHWRSAWLAYWQGAPDPFWAPSSSDCHILEPGESCSIELVFDPLHPGIWRGWQEVRSQIEGEPWTELELSGEGIGPWVPVTPGHLAFESVTVGMATDPQTITLESQDREEFRIEDISFTPVSGGWPLSSPFQVVGGSCHEGASLAPGKTCTIEVVMTPTVSGLFQSELEITDTAPGSPQSVELKGTATPADGPLISRPTATTQPARVKRACPKGRRKAIKKGRRICVKRRRHRRHPAHAGDSHRRVTS
ncbi:MAG TPA: choice-of-anchor D domain-containing protein [Solirubrobacterales bacterium]|nr:choice-of-anchor D domain-containing protein [Solirubrobacterales bacterium]